MKFALVADLSEERSAWMANSFVGFDIMPSPRISVLLPVWNGEKYLAEALDSILQQSFTDFELLVIDDGSTDSTPDILRACQDLRLRTFRLEHAGIVAALNLGISEAKACWIARQDADDVSYPHRLEEQWTAVSRSPQAVLCHTGVELFGDGAAGLRAPWIPRSRALAALQLCFQCPIVHSTVLFKKCVVQAVGGYRPEERHAEDYGLWGRIFDKGDFLAIPEKLVRYRVHAESISHQKRETQLMLTHRTAVEHSCHFMKLSPADGERAVHALSIGRHNVDWSEWLWFAGRCLPRLRYKSAEVFAWIAMQTGRMALRSICR